MAQARPRNFRTIISQFIPPILKNSMGNNITNLPLFNRGTKVNLLNEEILVMQDQDYYTDYLYAAIRNRANKTAKLAVNNLFTAINDNQADDAVSETPHPFLATIDTSPTFSNFWFWKTISTYIDLKGVAYLLVRRNFNTNTFGAIQEFKVLNSYQVHRVVSETTGELGGYIETKGSMQRQIPPQQMIEVKELNPFNLDIGYAMVDAAKNNQFLSQSASRYTRHAIKDNVSQRGLLTTEVVLEDEDYENFKARVRSNAGSGDFLYANGPGAVSYVDMQIDLDKLALDKINEISRQGLFAVSGTSKTGLGIEVSGVTRETSRVQKEINLEDQIEPQLQLIIDAFNQDYRNNYSAEYESNHYEIRIDSPSKIDKETEMNDATVVQGKAIAAKNLVQAGFDPQSVLEQVGFDPMDFTPPAQPTPPNNNPEANQNNIVINSLDDLLKTIALGQESTLITNINNFQRKVLLATIKKIVPNALTPEEQKKILSTANKKKLQDELAGILEDFYVNLIPLLAPATLRERFKQYHLKTEFKLDTQTRAFIVERAGKAAASHMDTILEEIYNTARNLTGLGRDDAVRQLTQLYNDSISKARAKVIARTETNRAVAQAQYEADRQFIQFNGLEDRAYKKWITRSSNPCPFCIDMASQPPIPFGTSFIELGDSITSEFQTKSGTSSRTFVAGYEPIDSGTMHPNCSCIYELIIKRG